VFGLIVSCTGRVRRIADPDVVDLERLVGGEQTDLAEVNAVSVTVRISSPSRYTLSDEPLSSNRTV